MRKSGFLMLLLVALLVILPVVASAITVDNGSFELAPETKIGIEEEVGVYDAEMLAAFAVDTRTAEIAANPLITAHSASRGLHNYWRLVPVIRGGEALRGGP